MSAKQVPQDLSFVRGFNYQSTVGRHHPDHWLQYDQATTDRELDLAARLDLNQARTFIDYFAYRDHKSTFLKNIVHLARSLDERGMGLMVVVVYPREMVQDRESWPLFREYAADLVHTLQDEPGLAFWDVSNEPDWSPRGTPMNQQRIDHARYMADVFHELDDRNPVTIGATFVDGMVAMADSVDVLSFHDYSPTRAEIRANIERAKAFAAEVGKPVFNTEIGCLCRANPYDVALQEHMDAGVGWYIWELMVTGYWGSVHGVFYPDGTVRDPAIAAAILGFFRNRGPEIVPIDMDREGHVRRVVENARAWLAQPEGEWEDGLALAETAANLLEAGQLTALNELPTRTVDLLRAGEPNPDELSSVLADYVTILVPYIAEE